MTVPFLGVALSFACGILLQPFYSRGVFWPLLFISAVLLKFFQGRRLFYVFLCAGFMGLGTVNADLDQRPAPAPLRLEVEKRGMDNFFAVTGKVVTEPEIKIYGRKQTVSFLFETEKIRQWEKLKAETAQEARGKLQIFLNQPGGVPEVGDTLRLWGRMEDLPENLNPGGFRYKDYLKNRNIDFIFNAYGAKAVRLVRPGSLWDLKRVLSRIRGSVRSRLEQLFQGKESVLLRALILGDRKNLRGEILDDFFKTGTMQVFAMPNRGILESSVASNFVINASS